MAAIVHPHPAERPTRPHLVLVGPDYRASRPAPLVRRAPSRRVAYRRRRLAAVVVLVALAFVVQLVLHAASAWLGGGSLTASEPRSAPAAATVSASSVHVVQPGDTLWTLARRAQPTGDVRPLVGRLAAAQDGRALRPGQRIVLP